MKNKVAAGLIIFSAILIINSCENKQAPVPSPSTVAVISSNCDTANLTFSSGKNTMQPIINIQCGVNNSNCHSYGGAANLPYTTYSGIYTEYQNGQLYQALFGNGSQVPQMPLVQQSGWDQCDLDKFKAWINKGCPQ